eukprot:TRINITY_DN50905_c0_g1_i1.p1 TRINITY_DN50905_c0_g1~~TRINITY_DN50905_c0_g1_i1.p1  ORF type:complete len:175 (+),score=32.56 TRINITY_DN50905_c0_g1_i1:47-526(+)
MDLTLKDGLPVADFDDGDDKDVIETSPAESKDSLGKLGADRLRPGLVDRPTEAKKRAAPGDTVRELSEMLQAAVLSDENSPRGGGRSSPRSLGGAEIPPARAPIVAEAQDPDTLPEQACQESRERMPAQRRAAPGDTLREELAVMRMGVEAPERGRGRQ